MDCGDAKPPLCASCGAEIRIDWVIQPSLCPACEDKIQHTVPGWTKKENPSEEFIITPEKFQNKALKVRELPMCKLSVHGSRTLTDERVRILILEEIAKLQADEIVTHGEPEGVCGVARALCKEKAIPLKLHFLNFKFLRGAFEHRSKSVLHDAEFALFIHDGKSKGTSNEIILAQKMKIPHTVHQIPITEHKHSVGFEIEQPWGADLPIEELGEIQLLENN